MRKAGGQQSGHEVSVMGTGCTHSPASLLLRLSSVSFPTSLLIKTHITGSSPSPCDLGKIQRGESTMGVMGESSLRAQGSVSAAC